MIDEANMKLIKNILTPRVRDHVEGNEEYIKGWNDAVKEVDENYKNYIFPIINKEE